MSLSPNRTLIRYLSMTAQAFDIAAQKKADP